MEQLCRSLLDWRQNVKASNPQRSDVVVREGILKLHLSDNRRSTAARYEARLRQEGLWSAALAPHLSIEATPELRTQRAWDQQPDDYDTIEDRSRILQLLRRRFQSCLAA